MWRIVTIYTSEASSWTRADDDEIALNELMTRAPLDWRETRVDGNSTPRRHVSRAPRPFVRMRAAGIEPSVGDSSSPSLHGARECWNSREGGGARAGGWGL